jgi:UPF0755 protein
MNKKAKYLLVFLVCLVLIFFLSVAFCNNRINEPIAGAKKEIKFQVEEGDSLQAVGKRLEEKSIIRSGFFFEFYGWLTGREEQIKAGKYNLNSEMSIKEIMNKMAGGNIIKDIVTVRIIEGKRLTDIADILEKQGVAAREEFLEVTGYPKKIYAEEEQKNFQKFVNDYEFLESKPAQYGLEGYLFPDTYEFYKDIEPEEVVMKMLNNFSRKLTPAIREDIKDKNRTIHEVVTMASLLEKEAKTEEEMKIVAGIFWDRIEQEMPLQSCATIAYALGRDKIKYSNLDTEINSPYNTYKYKGLPPAPIGNPGLKAILAAVYPIDTDYQYFLSPVGSDKTLFSKTYEEHLRKKRRYVD